MEKRFYCPMLPETGQVVLDGPEAHHLAKVMRLPPGERVALFNGIGTVALAEITHIGKREVTLHIHEREEIPPSATPLTLAVAVPKGDRFDWLIEKATELGVVKLIPVRTARGVVDPRETKLDRLRQVIIESCKQSRRPWLMELAPLTDFATLLQTTPQCFVADPSGSPFYSEMQGHPRAAGTVVVIGPEGGWTEAELAAAREAGAKIVSLGDSILRIETAAITVAALWRLTS